MTLIEEFKQCLNTMSHCRAGWDYVLPAAQRAEEDRQEKAALIRARSIWAENPDLHEKLIVAFAIASPLASMSEIDQRAA